MIINDHCSENTASDDGRNHAKQLAYPDYDFLLVEIPAPVTNTCIQSAA